MLIKCNYIHYTTRFYFLPPLSNYNEEAMIIGAVNRGQKKRIVNIVSSFYHLCASEVARSLGS